MVGSPTAALFHSIDVHSSGQDQGKGIVYFTAYHIHADLAESVVAILPALIQDHLDKVATNAWFHYGLLEALGEVTFHYDDAGNRDGTWSTLEDDLAQDILDEEMGVTFEFDNMPDTSDNLLSLLPMMHLLLHLQLPL